MTAAPLIAVVVAVTLTGESMTASCQPASTQLVTTTDGCRCKAGLEILKGRSRLISDVRPRGTASSRCCPPVIEANSARTAAGRPIPVIPLHSVEWAVQARLATMVHDGVRRSRSDLRLFRDLECVIDLNAEVSHGRLQFGMPEKQLDCAKVRCASVNQRRLGSAHRMCAVVCAVQA